MNDKPRVGDVLSSNLSEAQFVVLETGDADRMASLDGEPLHRGRRPACSAPVSAGPHDLCGGRRHLDPHTGLILLCVRPGRGHLNYDGRRLVEMTRTKPQLMAKATPQLAKLRECG
jgi:hypothetical protein